MNRLCPLCQNSLSASNIHNNEITLLSCKTCKRSNYDSKFSLSYNNEKSEVVRCTLYLDAYCVDNSYTANKTIISMMDKESPEPRYKAIIYLPLVHFEFDSLDKIRQKLKLLLTLM